MDTLKTFDTPKEALAYMRAKLMKVLLAKPIVIDKSKIGKKYTVTHTHYQWQLGAVAHRIRHSTKKQYTYRLVDLIEKELNKLKWRTRSRVGLINGFTRVSHHRAFYPLLPSVSDGYRIKKRLLVLYKKKQFNAFREEMRKEAIESVLKVRSLVSPNNSLCWNYRDKLVSVKPPDILKMDNDGRPHSFGGPAVVWKDEKLFFIHGRLIKNKVIENIDNLTEQIVWALIRSDKIASGFNIQYTYGASRTLLAIGLERVLKVLHVKRVDVFKTDTTEFRLLKATKIGNENRYTVAGLKIIEPTGVRIIPVDPKYKTAKEAVRQSVKLKLAAGQGATVEVRWWRKSAI